MMPAPDRSAEAPATAVPIRRAAPGRPLRILSGIPGRSGSLSRVISRTARAISSDVCSGATAGRTRSSGRRAGSDRSARPLRSRSRRRHPGPSSSSRLARPHRGRYGRSADGVPQGEKSGHRSRHRAPGEHRQPSRLTRSPALLFHRFLRPRGVPDRHPRGCRTLRVALRIQSHTNPPFRQNPHILLQVYPANLEFRSKRLHASGTPGGLW